MDSFAPELLGNLVLKDVLGVEGSFLVLYLVRQALRSGKKVGASAAMSCSTASEQNLNQQCPGSTGPLCGNCTADQNLFAEIGVYFDLMDRYLPSSPFR